MNILQAVLFYDLEKYLEIVIQKRGRLTSETASFNNFESKFTMHSENLKNNSSNSSANILLCFEKRMLRQYPCIFFLVDSDIPEKGLFRFVSGQQHDAGRRYSGKIHIRCSGAPCRM